MKIGVWVWNWESNIDMCLMFLLKEVIRIKLWKLFLVVDLWMCFWKLLIVRMFVYEILLELK